MVDCVPLEDLAAEVWMSAGADRVGVKTLLFFQLSPRFLYFNVPFVIGVLKNGEMEVRRFP